MSMLMVLLVGVGPGMLKAGALSSALSQVSSAVSLARSEAVMSRRPTFFVLAPESPLDERSYRYYAILQATEIYGTNYEYVRRWEKLPNGVLFHLTNSTGLVTNNLPYPNDAGALQQMAGICFVPGGGLDDDLHPPGNKPVIALQTGARLSSNSPAEFQGEFKQDKIVVERLSGKVSTQRLGAP